MKQFGTFTAYDIDIENLKEGIVDEPLQIDDDEEIARFENKEEAINELKKYTSTVDFTQTMSKGIYAADFKRVCVVEYDEVEEEYKDYIAFAEWQ